MRDIKEWSMTFLLCDCLHYRANMPQTATSKGRVPARNEVSVCGKVGHLCSELWLHHLDKPYITILNKVIIWVCDYKCPVAEIIPTSSQILCSNSWKLWLPFATSASFTRILPLFTSRFTDEGKITDVVREMCFRRKILNVASLSLR